MQDAMIDVAMIAHPFAAERQCLRLPAGLRLSDMIARAQPDALLRRHVHAWVDGDYVPPARHAQLRPKPGCIVTLRAVPMGGGGGGKNPLRTILSIAIMAASPAIAGGIMGAMGASASASFMGISAGRLVTAGVNLVGRLALNAIAPPPKARFSAPLRDSPTHFLQGAQNKVTPFGRVPKVLGRHRFVPPMGALPYTETAGNDQYLRMLFVWGYGPLQVEDLRIGETPLAEFDGVEIETRQGYDDDAPLSLYSNAVLQNDLQVVLRESQGYVLRTGETATDEISVDLTLPRGLFRFDANNAKVNAQVRVEVQYALSGTDDWSAPAQGFKPVAAAAVGPILPPSAYAGAGASHEAVRIDRIVMEPASGQLRLIAGTPSVAARGDAPAQPPMIPAGCRAIAAVERRSGDGALISPARITDERALGLEGSLFEGAGDFAPAPGADNEVAVAAGGIQFAGFDLTAKQATTLRRCISFRVPTGQYDVRLRRLTADAADDNTFDETVWTALRCLRYARPLRMTGLAVTALKIKATDQLNGVIDRFNGVVTSILPDWNGADWAEQPTSNPAALYRHVLQGRGNARPLADARLDLARLQAWHERCAAQGRGFNAVIDYDVSVREVLEDIAAVGRASPAVTDGKWSVVEDRPQSVPVQHFTPRNSFGFQGRKAFEDMPHALRVRFLNSRNGWMQDERLVYDDGQDAETAQYYETLELAGVTDPEQAWRDGRYHIATARLRPETYQFYADIEHIVCTRGDLIRFSHDVPMFGLMTARLKSVAAQDGNITGATLDSQVEMEAGKSYGLRIRTAAGASVLAAVATQAGAQDMLVFTPPLPPDSGVAAGDLAMFGESGRESVEMVVRAIEPQGDLRAKLTCVDAAPAIHAADTGDIPAFDSQITLPAEMRRPPAPVVTQVQSGAESLIRHTDGSFTTRITVTLAPPEAGLQLSLRVQLRARGESAFHPAQVLSQSGNSLSITGVEEGEIYDLLLRYVTPAGLASAPAVVQAHKVAGTSTLPADVRDFSLRALGDTLHLSWQRVADVDLSHYTLRFSPQTESVTWANAVEIVSRIAMDATSLSLPVAQGTYLIKAVDVGGNGSENAAAAVCRAAGLGQHNAVLTVTEDGAFSGDCAGMAAAEGALRLAGADSADDWADLDAVDNVDIGLAGILPAGVYGFAQEPDLGAVYTSRLTADLALAGTDLHNGVDSWEQADAVECWDESVDSSLWDVALELCTTADDPALSPQWSGWMPFVVGDYTARAFRFRLRAQTRSAHVTPVVTRLRVTIDMPDRTEGAQSLLAPEAGRSVSFAHAFRAPPALSIAPHDLQTGDYYRLSDCGPQGFAIRFYDSAGGGVARHFDYMAKGYGLLQ